PAEERQTCLFPTALPHRPSFFSSLSPQEFIDLSNQMYIVKVNYATTSGCSIGNRRLFMLTGIVAVCG
ncbi:hypothetical protein, partial [Aneurinibacillus migulanus]|uniref:hypothetical protein n=1 Tax=Aneurinibacillus migulanus TaxID=47500 RepID=UPI001C3FDC1A